jgi:hypothetical protein
MLTRAGSFVLDAEGGIVTPDGMPLLDAGGAPVFVPPGRLDLGRLRRHAERRRHPDRRRSASGKRPTGTTERRAGTRFASRARRSRPRKAAAGSFRASSNPRT